MEIKIEFTADTEGLKKAQSELDGLKSKISGIPAAPSKSEKSFDDLHNTIKNVKAQTQLMTGAMILFGNKSAEIQQIIGKLHGAILLIKGVAGLSGLSKAFEGVSLSTLSAKRAFDALKVAFASNPFGLLLTVLSSVVVAMGLFSDSTEEASKEVSDLNDQIEAFNKGVSDSHKRTSDSYKDTLETQIKLLELSNQDGRNSEEIAKKKTELFEERRKQVDREITDAKHAADELLANNEKLSKEGKKVSDEEKKRAYDKAQLAQDLEKNRLAALSKINNEEKVSNEKDHQDKLQREKDAEEKRLKALQEAKDKEAKFLAARREAEKEADFQARQLQIDVMDEGNAKELAKLKLAYDKDVEAAAKKYVDELHLYGKFTEVFTALQDKFEKDKTNLNSGITKLDKPIGPDGFDQFQKLLKDSTLKSTEDTENAKKELRRKIATETEQLLLNIFKQGMQDRIDSLEEEKQRTLDSFDERIKANQDRRSKEIISERDFRKEDKKLNDQKVKAEADANKKIREEKRKMAIIEKAEKLFEIAIATAANAIKQPGLLGALVPYWIALGAIQTAAVLAAPLPKYHSGRLASTSAAEELAIIRKDETVTDPEKSKAFAPTLAAIHKSKVPAMELNRFVRNYGKTDNKAAGVIDYDKFASTLRWYLKDHTQVRIKNFPELAALINNNHHAVFQH